MGPGADIAGRTSAAGAPTGTPAIPVSRWTRLLAAGLDAVVTPLAAVLALACCWPLLVHGASRAGASVPALSPLGRAVVVAASGLTVLLQRIVFARTGRSLGARFAGLRWRVAASGATPGFGRALLHSIQPWLWLAFAVSVLRPPASVAIAVWIVLGVFASTLVGAACFSAFALVLMGSDQSLHDRLAELRAEHHVAEALPAFVAPRFSPMAFLAACFGIVASLMLAAGAWALVGFLRIESTDLDLPALAAGVAAILGFVAAGALSAFQSRRFVVGELALVSLLLAVTLLAAMASGLLPVPAMQRYEAPGWLDWSVYAAATHFATIVFLVIGSALGFMAASDTGFDPSTRFERLVARRHLRLRLSHWLQLAVIATLAPIVIYGLFVWPIRSVVRLVRGEKAPKPQPPTVFMALLTIVGVMFGVMSLTVVLAVMGGFERDLKEKILGTNAHGVVHRYVGDFTEWRDVERKVKAVPGVEGVTPFILSEVMITTETSVAGSVLKGIDVETAGQVTDLEKNIDVDNGSLKNLLYPDRIPRRAKPPPGALDEGEPPPQDSLTATADKAGEPDEEVFPGIVIGREMARALHVWIGDRVTVMNPLGELGPSGPIPRSRTFRVAAVFVSGMYEYDSKFAYIALKDAQRFFRMGDAVTGLELRFSNVDEARPLMRRIISVLEGFPYRGKDWGEMNQNLFSALRLERVVMFILLSFQVLIACICVIATLVMLVVEKRKEVATLKAMGAREGSIMKLFVIEGLIIGAIGTFYGSAAGLLFCKLIEKFGVGLDPEVYYITRLPVVIEPAAFVSVALVAMLLVFVATIYPARRGGSIAPVEGFREE